MLRRYPWFPVAFGTATLLFASGVPTPLYPLYQRDWGFSSGVLTLVFSGYVVGISAVLFPFRQKAMFNDSPITKQKLGGLPLFSIVGAVDAALMILYVILLFVYGSQTGATNKTAIIFMAVLVAALAAVWVIAWVLARQRGLDLGVVQAQLPPE